MLIESPITSDAASSAAFGCELTEGDAEGEAEGDAEGEGDELGDADELGEADADGETEGEGAILALKLVGGRDSLSKVDEHVVQE